MFEVLNVNKATSAQLMDVFQQLFAEGRNQPSGHLSWCLKELLSTVKCPNA